MSKLSTVLSEAVEQALNDMLLCIEDDKYIIRFENWHKPMYDQFNKKSQCEVCFAGATMAKTLKIDHKKNYSPGKIEIKGNKKTALMLVALDKIRSGNIVGALKCLNKSTEDIKNIFVDPNNLDLFVKDIKKIIKYLKSKNL